MADITAIILTKNEEKNLPACLKSIQGFCSRAVVVEGGSTQVATDESIQKQRKKKFGIYYKAPMFLRAKLWFIYNYIFKLGFLDGKEGFIFHYLECDWYRTLVDAKILEYKLTGVKPEKLTAIN